MKKISIIYLVLMLALPVLLQAQYLGGIGRGDVSLESLNNPLTNAGNNNITVPVSYALHQNYPNPFNPVTKISFDIPKHGFVSLIIFDVLGREVCTLVNEVKTPGSYSVDFDGENLSGGVYFCRLQSAEFTDIKRVVLLK